MRFEVSPGRSGKYWNKLEIRYYVRPGQHGSDPRFLGGSHEGSKFPRKLERIEKIVENRVVSGTRYEGRVLQCHDQHWDRQWHWCASAAVPRSDGRVSCQGSKWFQTTGPAPRNSEFLTFSQDFPDFPWETSNLKNYCFWEASKYNCLSKCSTHGNYRLTKSCIFKPPKSSSF